MKKILFVMDSMVLGGSQRILLTILKMLPPSYHVELLLINDYGIYLDDIPKGIKVYSIFSKYKQVPFGDIKNYDFYQKVKIIFNKVVFRGKVYLNYIRYVSNKIVNDEYDYVIGFQEGPANFVAANMQGKAKKIGWLHSDINMLTKKQSEMELGVYQKLDKIICVSDFVKLSAIKKHEHIKCKAYVLHNPIDFEVIRRQSVEDVELIYDEFINIISIGRLSPEKQLDLLIKKLSKYLHEHDEVKLHIVGDGPERLYLNRLIDTLELDGRVILHGLQKNPYKYLKMSDIYISASLYEGLPTTIIEAMVLNKMIIANDIPANVELLKDYEPCAIVNVENDLQLVSAIDSVLDAKSECDNLWLEERFSLSTFLTRFSHLLES